MMERQVDNLELLEYFEYLDILRESGVTNMFGAGVYLQDEFGLDKREARQVLLEWMQSFAERHGLEE
ncbi:MAG: hypothetical protein GWN58_35335 [Anaerolineae bacterium]|nr:hypothetical protein [Anaerolineae bacterium]